MRTVITYLDKEKKRTTKENAWTVMTQVFNDAGNLQRTGFSIGMMQAKAQETASDAVTLSIRDESNGKIYRFHQSVIKVGRDSSCDIVFDQKEDRKKIDKIHAFFELRQGVWHVMDTSKSGVWLNNQKIASNIPVAVKAGDCLDLGQRKKIRLE